MIGLASLTSSLHHSVEVVHYQPALVHASPQTQWWLLQTDRFFATLAVIGISSFKLLEEQWFLIGTTFLAGIVSELVMRGHDHKNAEMRFVRVILHSYWHVMMEGYIAYMAVTRYQGEKRFIDFLCSV